MIMLDKEHVTFKDLLKKASDIKQKLFDELVEKNVPVENYVSLIVQDQEWKSCAEKLVPLSNRLILTTILSIFIKFTFLLILINN